MCRAAQCLHHRPVQHLTQAPPARCQRQYCTSQRTQQWHPERHRPLKLKHKTCQRPAHRTGHDRRQKTGQQPNAGQLNALHLAQQTGARAHRPHDGKLTGTLLPRGCHGGKQHHQTGRQGKGKQEFHCTDHLVQHTLDLCNGGRHVDAGDVGKLAHQRIVKTLGGWCLERAHVGGRNAFKGVHRVHDKEVGAHRTPVDLAQRRDLGHGLHATHVKGQRVTQPKPERFGNTLLDTDGPGLVGLPAPGDQFVLARLGGAV